MMDFDSWKAGVELNLQILAGTSLDRLPDLDLEDCFESGLSPRTVAVEILQDLWSPD